MSDGFDREVGQCDHEQVRELDPESYDLGDKVTCDDCGLGFVVETDKFRGDRYFVAENVEPHYVGEEESLRNEHSETVVVLQRDGATAAYLWSDVGPFGVDLARIVDGEESHMERLTWSEVGRMLQNRTMRVYGMTPEEVENID